MDELYKQEILELTELLKNDEEWEDLRNILNEQNIDLKHIALVSFTEDEEENEYGIIIFKDLKIIEYSRFTGYGDNNFCIIDITSDKEEINKYPQIGIAIDMIKNNELL